MFCQYCYTLIPFSSKASNVSMASIIAVILSSIKFKALCIEKLEKFVGLVGNYVLRNLKNLLA